MVVRVNPSQLRADLYRMLDRVVETGEPVEIDRAGHRLRIILTEQGERPARRLDALTPMPELVTGDPEDLVHCDWSSEWRP